MRGTTPIPVPTVWPTPATELPTPLITSCTHSTSYDIGANVDQTSTRGHNVVKFRHNGLEFRHNVVEFGHNGVEFRHNVAEFRHNVAEFRHNVVVSS